MEMRNSGIYSPTPPQGKWTGHRRAGFYPFPEWTMRRKQPKTFHHFWAVDNTISDLAKLDPLPPPQRENLKKKKKKKKLILPDISILSISRSITLCCLSCPSLAPTVGLVSNRVNIPLKKKKKKNCRYRFSQTRKAAQSWNREHTNSRQTVRVREKREKYTSCPCLKPNNIKDNDHPA